ncbi:MAG: AbrB family transcriptional regulator [Betaproteobacteria bacterium]|jgi:bifunctional DNA-binding transcriptional regulator/antitoxin component of YhaV-PrlF toxin-antitoxin module
MSNVTMASKGKIAIPVKVCNNLKVGAGDQVELVLFSSGRHELLASNSQASALKGMLRPAKNVVSIESMNASTINDSIYFYNI